MLRWLVCGLMALVMAGSAMAQGVVKESRVALVIGNSEYEHAGRLGTPGKDAADMAAALEAAGFKVITALNIPKRQFDKVLRGFVEAIEKADVALLYYAGHGLQVGDKGFLVPTDAALKNERDAPYEAVALDFVLREMVANRNDRTSIVLLDACRDNPLSRTMASATGATRSLAGGGLPDPGKGLGTGLFVAFATEPGKVALDQEAGTGNSPFTRAMLQEMLVRGRSISDTMIAVRNAVSRVTNGSQVPWDQSSLTKPFVFLPQQTAASQPTAPAPTSRNAEELAALQKKLAALEAEQQRWKAERDAEKRSIVLPPPPQAPRPASGPSSVARFNVRLGLRAVGTLLATTPTTANCESRCQAEASCVAWNLSRGGECELLSGVTHRVSAADWRSGIRLDVEATLKGPTAIAPNAPPVTPKPGPPPRHSADFEERENVGLMGVEIGPPFKAASPVVCRQACEANAACVGYQHGKKIAVMGQCELFSRIDARREDAQWRSGVKVALPAPANPPGTIAKVCHPMSIQLTNPIPLSEGMRLCNGIGINETIVERISDLTVEFYVVGGTRIACRPNDVCQFDWPGAPSPRFQVEITAGGPGRKPVARIVGQKR